MDILFGLEEFHQLVYLPFPLSVCTKLSNYFPTSVKVHLVDNFQHCVVAHDHGAFDV
jgi:hypothetical protein